MKNSLISVIMPVFNAQCYLNDSVSDILEQTYTNLEIILVNDGSTDNSLDILHQFEEKDSRVRVVTAEKRGVAAARNAGLNIATGDFIRFVDADDRIPADSIQNLYEPYQKYDNIDLVIGNYTCSPINNYMMGELIQEGQLEQKDFICVFLNYVKSFYFGVTWNKLYRHDLIKENNLCFDENLFWCEDFMFNVNYFRICNLFYIIKTDRGIYKYCKREDSITENLAVNNDIFFKQIDEMRYTAMKDYCMQQGIEEKLDLEWKFSELYGKLSKVTKKQSKKVSIKKRYQNFKVLLQDEGVYQYLYQKERESHLVVWKLLKYSLIKKKYWIAFCFFWVKGFAVVYFKKFIPWLREYFLTKIPKNF